MATFIPRKGHFYNNLIPADTRGPLVVDLDRIETDTLYAKCWEIQARNDLAEMVNPQQLADFLTEIQHLSIARQYHKIAAQVLREIRLRLDFLLQVGLSYLNLSRSAGSLSGGEAQRILVQNICGVPLIETLLVFARRDTVDYGYELRGSMSLGPLAVGKKLHEATATFLAARECPVQQHGAKTFAAPGSCDTHRFDVRPPHAATRQAGYKGNL